MPLEIANTSADPRDALVLQYVQSSSSYTRLSTDILANNVTQITVVQWSVALDMLGLAASREPGYAWSVEGNYFVTVNHNVQYPLVTNNLGYNVGYGYVPVESMLFHELSHYALNHVQSGNRPFNAEGAAVTYTNGVFHYAHSILPRNNYSPAANAVIDGARYLSKPKCFSAETRILMIDGHTKQIEAFVAGDFVQAFAEQNNRTDNALYPQRVTRILHGVTTDWIVLDDGTRVTPGHQYLRPDGSFMAIADILALDGMVVDAAGRPKHVTGELLRGTDAGSDAAWIEPEPFAAGNTLLKPAPVFGWRTYNLTVEGLHTYIAGGCRVHNDCVQDGDQITDVDFDPVTNELVWTGTDVNGGAITITETRNPITGAVQIVERELSFGSNDAVVSSVWSTFDANHTPVGDPVQTVTFPGQVFTGNAIGGIFGSAIGQAIGGGNVFASVGAQAALSTVLGTVGHSLHIYFNDTHLSNVAGTAAATLEESVAVALNGVGAALGNNLLAAGSGANDNARLDAATGERTVA
jgi:hypothetical protein